MQCHLYRLLHCCCHWAAKLGWSPLGGQLLLPLGCQLLLPLGCQSPLPLGCQWKFTCSTPNPKTPKEGINN